MGDPVLSLPYTMNSLSMAGDTISKLTASYGGIASIFGTNNIVSLSKSNNVKVTITSILTSGSGGAFCI